MEAGELTLLPSDLLIYIDETGHERMNDPRFPVFGLGGCAVLGGNYYASIEKPWKELKERHFGGPDAPLHASGLDISNKAGIEAVGKFFEENSFGRFATVIGSGTRMSGVSEPYEALAAIVVSQLTAIVQRSTFHRFVLIFESSHRGNALAMRYFSNIQPMLAGPEGPFPAPIERCFLSKTLVHPPLEVADFVVHAAGRQALRHFSAKDTVRRDFKAVFGSKRAMYAESHFVESAKVTRGSRA